MEGASASACSKNAPVCPRAANVGNKTELSETAFRLAEKRYKLFRLDERASKRHTIEESDFSDVIDFHSLAANSEANQAMMHLISEIDVPIANGGATQDDDRAAASVGITFTSEQECDSDTKRLRSESSNTSRTTVATRKQRCYTFDGVPGLLFFPQALTDEEQQYWCTQALDKYAQSPPFPNNLTTLDPNIATKRYGGPHERKEQEADGTVTANVGAAATVGDGGKNGSGNGSNNHPPAKEKMRWATLGFKYNWTSKTYSPSEYCLFPSNLSAMIKKTFFTMLAPVASAALGAAGGDAEAVTAATAKAMDLARGLQMPCKKSGNSGGCSSSFEPSTTVESSCTTNLNNLPAAAAITLRANEVAASHRRLSNDEILSALLSPSYEPQTAIVNYFPVGTMMCAHQDLSEPCLHRPLLSVSIGCSSIFLMGTTSRDDKPHAFLLRSGDIVAFTGPSRVAFHAVPRVLEDCPKHLSDYDSRMGGLRININVRQVYDEPQPQLVGDDV